MTIYNFQLLNVPFANTAIASEIAPFPDYNRGLGIAFSQTDGKPEMKGLNGLFNIITASMLYLKQRGIAEWDATLEYPDNAFVTEGSKLYKSKRINTNKQPSLSQIDWDVWASISDISVSTNGNLKKTVASDGSVTLEVPTADTTQRGVARRATPAEVANRENVNAYVTPKDVSDINQSIGVGQEWYDVTSSRTNGIDYLNNTGRTIFVSIVFGAPSLQGVVYYLIVTKPNNQEVIMGIDAPIPANHKYRLYLAGPVGIHKWAELK